MLLLLIIHIHIWIYYNHYLLYYYTMYLIHTQKYFENFNTLYLQRIVRKLLLLIIICKVNYYLLVVVIYQIKSTIILTKSKDTIQSFLYLSKLIAR